MFQQAMAEKPDIDAIFCTNDDTAVGVLLECQAQQYDVPGKWRLPVSTGWKLAVRGCKNRQRDYTTL